MMIDSARLSKKPVFWIVLGLILLLIAVVAFSFFGTPATPSPTTNTGDLVQSTVLKRAPVGQLVEGFPKELILDKGAKLVDSAEYQSPTPGDKKLEATYATGKSLDEIRKSYLSYFQKEGWKVLVDQQPSGDSDYILAAEEGGDYVKIRLAQTVFLRGYNCSVVVEFNHS
jgi:hypothetical protein